MTEYPQYATRKVEIEDNSLFDRCDWYPPTYDTNGQEVAFTEAECDDDVPF